MTKPSINGKLYPVEYYDEIYHTHSYLGSDLLVLAAARRYSLSSLAMRGWLAGSLCAANQKTAHHTKPLKPVRLSAREGRDRNSHEFQSIV